MTQPSSKKRKLIYVIASIIVLYMVLVAARFIYGSYSATTSLFPHLELTSKYKYINPKTGYRMGHYRAPTPDTIKQATRIDSKRLEKMLLKPDTLLIDVMAHVGAGWDPLSGAWLVSKPRYHIPGSTWLPDVGAGHLSFELEKYFKSNIERLTKGDKSRPLVVYCQSDCWMSWNAVRRLISWGYENIFWYPKGHDGWVETDHKLVKASPIPLDIN